MKNLPENFKDKKVCVMGLGYVGLTFAVTLADIGFEVFGVEVKDDILKKLVNGIPHFFEPGLQGTLKKVLKTKNLILSKKIPKKKDISVFIITVGTPLKRDKKTNTVMIKNVCNEIKDNLRDKNLVILRSTVEIGSTKNICKKILNNANKKYEIAFCPERTLEGKAMNELRILPQIIGSDNLSTRMRCSQFFSFITPTVVQVSSLETAELIKLVDNCQRDVQFALSNEVAVISDVVGVSANEVISAGKLAYPRTNLPIAGPVGGPCLEKDSYILKNGLSKKRFLPSIIMNARKFNESLPKIVLKKLDEYLKKIKINKNTIKITLAGAAFKGQPETDDLRGTMAKPIYNELRQRFPRSKIKIFDPVVKSKQLKEFFNSEVSTDLESSFRDMTLFIIANNHPLFSSMPISNLSGLMKKPGIIFDFWNNFSSRNILFPEGINYLGLGELGLYLKENE
tara:strand:- start:830 stop:2191 length:1362 start_codon:yes stop_codon:yes gene_type:complete